MAFDVEIQRGEGTNKDIDWQAMNQYIVETAGLQDPETVVGVVAGIVDLGQQEMPDAEYVFVGTEEDEAAEIEKNPTTYFKDGIDPNTRKPARFKCWPQKPWNAVAVAIDFPDILVDKGQFFGSDQGPLPLRLWLGDNFYTKESGMIIARPTFLKEVNLEKDRSKPARWSLAQNSLFYKMAVAQKLIQPGAIFKYNRIDEVIGKAFQFQVQVFMRDGKDGKEYLTERIKFVGGLGRGQVAPENPNETFMVLFNRVNSEESLKNLRNHVVNTIKRAKNYNGSAIQKQLGDEVQSEEGQEPQAPAPEPKRTPPKAAPAAKAKGKQPATPVGENFDDTDLPF